MSYIPNNNRHIMTSLGLNVGNFSYVRNLRKKNRYYIIQEPNTSDCFSNGVINKLTEVNDKQFLENDRISRLQLLDNN